MDLPTLSPALSNQLSVELGVRGRRAVESLKTAQALLEIELGLLPRHGSLVAYCLRDALDEIAAASGVGGGNPRNALSKAVVEATSQYERALASSDEETVHIARRALFSHVEKLGEHIREPSGGNQERLTELFKQRTGSVPLSEGTTALREYQRLLDTCNRAGHGTCTLENAQRWWSECLEWLDRVFLAHERDPRPLRRLARIECPSEADLNELLGRLSTPVELRSFLGQVENPGWLWSLAQSDALEEPNSDLWWAACNAAVRLSDDPQDEILEWLTAMNSRHPGEAARVRCFASAARRIGGNAHDLLLEIVRKHRADEQIALEGLQAALGLDATHPMVVNFADALLSEASWNLLPIPGELLDHLSNGLDKDNAIDRIRLVVFKLRRTDEDLAVENLRHFASGTMDDAHTTLPGHRVSMLLGCLVRMLRSAWEWHHAATLLALFDGVPDIVRTRLRAWVLGKAPSVDVQALADEVKKAIPARSATGDDVALVDRALEFGDSDLLRARWRGAMGAAPNPADVQRALDGERTMPKHVWHVTSWIPLLPDSLAGEWKGPRQVLRDALGEFTREGLLTRDLPEVHHYDSPLSAQDFADKSPPEAAAAIAQWRLRPDRPYITARELGEVLQDMVSENPEGWLADPLGIVTALRHPTYISAYLRAVETLTSFTEADAGRLVDAATLVAEEPWVAIPLGRSGHHYQSNWREPRQAAVDLIGAIADSGASFGNRTDEAWNLIDSAARNRPPAGVGLGDDSRTFKADVPASANALKQAVRFVHAELQADRTPRPEFEQLLDYGLQLNGELGMAHREVIASCIYWLHDWLREWTDSAMSRIIGSDAPDDLGQATFELLLDRNAPSRWLCEAYANRVFDSAKRQHESALQHLLVAMLQGWEGYSVEFVAQFLQRKVGLIPDAARVLANLLDYEGVEDRFLSVSVMLWESLLDSKAASYLVPFGWMSIVKALDEDLWAKLTRQTLEAATSARVRASRFGRDDPADVASAVARADRQVAWRAMPEPFNVDKLAILDLLIRHTPSDWVRRMIADDADKFVTVGPELAGTPEFLSLRTALSGHGLVEKDWS